MFGISTFWTTLGTILLSGMIILWCMYTCIEYHSSIFQHKLLPQYPVFQLWCLYGTFFLYQFRFYFVDLQKQIWSQWYSHWLKQVFYQRVREYTHLKKNHLLMIAVSLISAATVKVRKLESLKREEGCNKFPGIFEQQNHVLILQAKP